MGMYTEFHFNAEIKGDCMQEVLDMLTFLVSGEPKSHEKALDDYRERISAQPHEFFETGRWPFMLKCDSYYFAADTYSTFRKDWQGDYYLCIRCNVKNYDNEIEKFIDWVKPYIAGNSDDFLGFYRYESNRKPTLVFKNETIDV